MWVSPKHFASCSWRMTALRAAAPERKTDAGCDGPGAWSDVRGRAPGPVADTMQFAAPDVGCADDLTVAAACCCRWRDQQ
jgi:hypothetical protein